MVKNPPAVRETWVPSGSGEDSPGEGNGHPLRYSCLEKLRQDRGTWQATVSPWRSQKSQTRLGRLMLLREM